MSNSFNLDLFRRTYQGPTVRVKLVAAENAASYLPAIPFTSSKDVMDYFSTLEEEPREVVIATYLDNKHHVLAIEEVSRGTLTASLFEPRAILQGALLTNAAALIMVHNHPSGDPKPSAEDLSVTKSLKQLTESNADPAPRPHHHWQEELRFTAGLGSPLSKPAKMEKQMTDMNRLLPRFPLGRIVATPGALRALEQANQNPFEFLAKTSSWRLGRALRRGQKGK